MPRKNTHQSPGKRPTLVIRRIKLVQLSMLLLVVGSLSWAGWRLIHPSQAANTLPAITSTLRTNPANNRWFVDASGKGVPLAGMHTWTNLQDAANHSTADPPPAFDWNTYISTMANYGQNFIRLWNPDYADTHCGDNKPHNTPTIYQRTGPGNDAFGKPKFDLTKFNQAYFDRLASRIADAQSKGVYVSVMLFDGNWSYSDCHFDGNYYNPANNVNGVSISTIGGTRLGQGWGSNVHDPNNTKLMDFQKAYVRKVIDTIGSNNNVLYEISNEEWGSDANVQWSYQMIDYIHQYEASKTKQHPVGMTPTWNRANGTWLNSNADWVSVCDCKNQPDDGNGGQSFRDNPEPSSGKKVIISDTDHYFGVGGDQSWAWKNFTRGNNPIYMYEATNPNTSGPDGAILPDGNTGGALHAMGDIVAYGNKMNLAKMTPQGNLASTGYALANTGQEYLAYQPGSGGFTVNLATGSYTVEWFNPTSRVTSAGGTTTGGGNKTFTPPFSGQAVLYLRNATVTQPTNNPPAVSLTAPASGTTVNGSTMLTATATDDTGVASVQFKSDGANIGTADITAPYSINWNTATAANGTHSLTATATDTNGATATSATVTVQVQNQTNPNPVAGDFDNNNKVNLTDLARLLSKWQTADVTTDINHSGKVDLTDLAILLSHWTGN
jgi:hypothetical protein